jgi:hypothetical protein
VRSRQSCRIDPSEIIVAKLESFIFTVGMALTSLLMFATLAPVA